MLDSMLDNGQIEPAWTDTDDFVACIKDVLNECRDNPQIIDYDDMCWLPIADSLAVRQYDRVFVDETQDLNAAQIKLALMACKPGGRICAVGDDRQAIYAFRGADAKALDNVVEALSAKVLPLSVTYRCASSIVDVAKAIVADYEAAPGADAGTVETIGREQIKALAKPGDFIISRKNAPLMSLCLAFLAAGVPATIAGRDIGANLLSLIDKSRATSLGALAAWLDRWQATEIERLTKRKNPNPATIDAVCDRVECINALCEGASSVAEVRAKIGSLFSDKDDATRIVLTTVHKAKGLERDRAFVLAGTFQIQRGVEEANLWYVAVTRARKGLFIAA